MADPNDSIAYLRSLVERMPENKDLPKPQFFMDPRSLSMANILKGGANTALNWLEGKPEIGPDTLAPLGLAPMGMALTPRNAVGVFGGPLAKTADHAALAKAQELAGKGIDRDFIWKETGWGLGPDGKWRFEIDDSKSRWKPEIEAAGLDVGAALSGYKDGFGRSPMQKDLFEHPDLYAAYPGTEKIGLGATKDLTARGSYDHAGTVRLNTLLTDDSTMKGVNLHELQHALQQREGFAGGASPSTVLREQYGGWGTKDNVDNSFDAVRRALERGETSATIKDLQGSYTIYGKGDLEKLDKELFGLLKLDEMDAYKRTAGEVESRNVQTRMDMNADERRAKPPWQTQDVPDEQQIVRFGGSGPQMSSLPMDEASRLNRAREMGFNPDETWWHSGFSNFNEFDPKKSGSGTFNFAKDKNWADQYGHTKSQDAQLDADIVTRPFHVRGNIFDPSNPEHLAKLESVLPDNLKWRSDYGWASWGGDNVTPKADLIERIKGVERPYTPLTPEMYNTAKVGDWIPNIEGQQALVVGKGEGYVEVLDRHKVDRNRELDELARLKASTDPSDRLQAARMMMDMRGTREKYAPRRYEVEPAKTGGNDTWDILESEGIRPYLRQAGFDGAKMTERKHPTLAMFDPHNIRLTKAAFNPADSDKAGLLLSRNDSVPGTVVNAQEERSPTLAEILMRGSY
jgi:hypothetical protein